MKIETPSSTSAEPLGAQRPLPPILPQEDLTDLQKETAGRVWRSAIFRAGAQVAAKKQKFDWKNPEHYQLALKEIQNSGPTPRLARILKESADYAAGIETHREPVLSAVNVLSGAFMDSVGLNAQQVMRHHVFQRSKDPATGETIGQQYLDAWRKVHPEEEQRFLEQSDRFLSGSKWEEIKAGFGSDLAAKMFTEFPPDYSTIRSLRPVLSPAHRKFWDELQAAVIASETEALKLGGGVIPAPEVYEKSFERLKKPIRERLLKEREKDWRLQPAGYGGQAGGAPSGPGEEASAEINERADLEAKGLARRGVDMPPLTPQEASDIFMAHLVHDPASQEIAELHKAHPWLRAIGGTAGMVAQWTGASEALKAGTGVTKWALPKLLTKVGLKSAAREAADLLARGAGMVGRSRGAQLASETLAYEASRAATQEVAGRKEEITGLWEALFSAGLMGGAGKLSQTFVEAWANRKMATHIAGMLQKKVPLEAGQTLAKRLEALATKPAHLQMAVEMGALELTRKAFELGKKGHGEDIEGEDFSTWAVRILSTVGFGWLASFAQTSRKMPWYQYEKGTLERTQARTEAAVSRLGLTKQVGKVPVEGGKTVGEALRDVFGPEAIEQNLTEIRRLKRADTLKAAAIGLTPEQVVEQRKAEAKRKEVPPETTQPAASPSSEAVKGALPVPAKSVARPPSPEGEAAAFAAPKAAALPPKVKPKAKSAIDDAIEGWRRSLWTARETSGTQRLPDAELESFERLTKALAYHQAKQIEKPEIDLWRGLGKYKGVSAEARAASSDPNIQKAKAAFKFAEKITYLFDTADYSALVHEQGHALRFLLSKRQMDMVWKGLGAKPGKQLTVEQEEQFAEQYRAFLEKGVAPTKSLQPVFDGVKQYLAAAQGARAEAPSPKVEQAIQAGFQKARKPTAPKAAAEAAPTTPGPVAPPKPKAREEPAAREEPESTGWKFAGKKARAELSGLEVAAGEKDHKAAEILDLAKKSETVSGALDALSLTYDRFPSHALRKLIEAVPLPPSVSAVKGAREAVHHLVMASESVVSPKPLRETLDEIADSGVAGVENRPDGSWELVTKSGLRVTMPSLGSKELLFMLGDAPEKSKRQEYLESVLDFRYDAAKKFQRLLSRIPGRPGGRGLARLWGRASGIGVDEIVGKWQDRIQDEFAKRNAVFSEIMAGIHQTKSQADRTAMYEALFEGTVENLPEHLRPTMAKAAQAFLDLAEVLYRNGYLTEEHLTKPYAPLLKATLETARTRKLKGELDFQEKEVSDAFGIVGAILRGIGLKRGQPVGSSTGGKLARTGIRALLATNLRQRKTKNLEEARATGFQISAEAILPALAREIRAATELKAIEWAADDPHLSTSTEPSHEEAHRWKKFTDEPKKWHGLAGKWVNVDIVKSVERMHGDAESLSMFWTAVHGLSKAALVVGNTGLHLTQMISNPIIANMAGLEMAGPGFKDVLWGIGNVFMANWKPKTWAPDATIREMIEHRAIQLDDFQHTAYQDVQVREEALDHLHRAGVAFDQGSPGAWGHLGAMFTKLAQYGLAEGTRPIPFKAGPSLWRGGRAALSIGDMAYGMALYRQARTGRTKFGKDVVLSPERAAQLANTVLMRRATTPPIVRGMSQVISFSAFPAKLITETPFQAAMAGAWMPAAPRDPKGRAAYAASMIGVEIMKWGLIAQGLYAAGRSATGLSDEDYQKQRLTAAFMDDFNAQFLIGMGNDKKGKPIFLDAKGLIFPWATLIDPLRRGHYSDRPMIQFSQPGTIAGALNRLTTPAWWIRQNVLASRLYEATVIGETYYGERIDTSFGRLWHAFGSPFVPQTARTLYKAVDRGMNPRGIRSGWDYFRQTFGLRIESPDQKKRILGNFNEQVEKGNVQFLRLPYGITPEARRAVRERQRQATFEKRRG